DAITLHPRSRAQQFGGQAPWDVIRSVVEAVSIPVTGNGDVLSLEDAERMRAETGCVDVMIGRGALGRPWVFDPAYERLDEDSQGEYRMRIVGAHIDAIEAFFPPREALLQTKKHLIRYTAGGPEAKARRASIFASKSIDALREAYVVRSEALAG
ncbi:MAG: tRNA-dihydrouridine synthase, partial [Chloroflexi bacterium]|nr:tRNA-dihydrouridine synthase [Chloroflexota bacterium]